LTGVVEHVPCDAGQGVGWTPDVAALGYCGWAAALYACDVPTQRMCLAPPSDVETIRALICEGVERLGLDAVRQIRERTQELSYLRTIRFVSTPDEDVELRRLWPSATRADGCRELAWRVRVASAETVLGQAREFVASRRSFDVR
jgi:hypothetical protein